MNNTNQVRIRGLLPGESPLQSAMLGQQTSASFLGEFMKLARKEEGKTDKEMEDEMKEYEEDKKENPKKYKFTKRDDKDDLNEQKEARAMTIKTLQKQVKELHKKLGLSAPPTIQDVGGSLTLKNHTGELNKKVPFNKDSLQFLSSESTKVVMEMTERGYPQSCIDEYRLAVANAKYELEKQGITLPYSAKPVRSTFA